MNTAQSQALIPVFYKNAWLYFMLALLVTIVGFFPSWRNRNVVDAATHHSTMAVSHR